VINSITWSKGSRQNRPVTSGKGLAHLEGGYSVECGLIESLEGMSMGGWKRSSMDVLFIFSLNTHSNYAG